jgi:hypothetical protein
MFISIFIDLKLISTAYRRKHSGGRNRHDRLEKLVNGFSKQMDDMVRMYQDWSFRMKGSGLRHSLSPSSNENVEGSATIILFDTHRESRRPLAHWKS